MKTIKKVEIQYKYVEYIPEVLEDNILYISDKYKVSVHKCLCGCNNLSVTSLKLGEWSLITKNDKISLTPSILNNNCPNKSHYIITNNIANFV